MLAFGGESYRLINLDSNIESSNPNPNIELPIVTKEFVEIDLVNPDNNSALLFSPEGHYLLILGEHPSIYDVYDAKNPNLIYTFDRNCSEARFNKTGDLLFLLHNFDVTIFNMQTFTEISNYYVEFRYLSPDPNFKYLIAANNVDDKVWILDILTGRKIKYFKISRAESINFLDDRHLITIKYTRTQDGMMSIVKIFDSMDVDDQNAPNVILEMEFEFFDIFCYSSDRSNLIFLIKDVEIAFIKIINLSDLSKPIIRDIPYLGNIDCNMIEMFTNSDDSKIFVFADNGILNIINPDNGEIIEIIKITNRAEDLNDFCPFFLALQPEQPEDPILK